MDEILHLDATSQAALVRDGQISATELLEASIKRADATHPSLNAVVIRFDGKARDQASGPLSGPFAGVPFLLKDLAQEYAGERNTKACTALSQQRAVEHSDYTRRCLAAGLVIYGRTATPELGLRGQTESKFWGPTRNPWDTGRTPGGSSGGSAAAVAAGVVAMAGANDGGGSIRIPAAYTGLFGLKPSRGRVSWGPAGGEEWEGASANGVLTRSVRDSAAMLDVLAGGCFSDPFVITPPARPYAQEVGEKPGRLRIGICTASPLDAAVDPDHVAAVHKAATLLRDLGHEVEEATPAIDGGELAAAFLTMYVGQVAADVAASGGKDESFELETRLLAWLGRALGAGDYVRSRRLWHKFTRAQAEFFGKYDIYVTPTVAGPAPVIGAFALPKLQQRISPLLTKLPLAGLAMKAGILEQTAHESLAATPFTQLANLTGTPSMSVPLYMEKGLPVGVQFGAGFGREDVLYRLAAQLEEAAPWANRWPAWPAPK